MAIQITHGPIDAALPPIVGIRLRAPWLSGPKMADVFSSRWRSSFVCGVALPLRRLCCLRFRVTLAEFPISYIVPPDWLDSGVCKLITCLCRKLSAVGVKRPEC